MDYQRFLYPFFIGLFLIIPAAICFYVATNYLLMRLMKLWKGDEGRDQYLGVLRIQGILSSEDLDVLGHNPDEKSIIATLTRRAIKSAFLFCIGIIIFGVIFFYSK